MTQKRFAFFLTSSLNDLHLPPLAERRGHNTLILFTYLSVFGQAPIPMDILLHPTGRTQMRQSLHF